MGQTSNYKWNQPEHWEEADRRAWNETLSAIDAAVAAKADSTSVDSRFTSVNSSISSLNKRLEVRIGSYTGDGNETRTISLGFTPKAVLLECDMGYRTDNGIRYGGLALNGKPVMGMSHYTALKIVSGGFMVYYYSGYIHTNDSSTDFYYLAFQ